MLERRAVAAPACDGRCGFGGVTAATPEASTVLLTFPPTGEARPFDADPSPPIALPVGEDDSAAVSTLPIRRPNGLPDVQVVVEVAGEPAAVVDRSGRTLFRTGPVPGRADGSVAALEGWYRYRGLTTQAGRVEVLDPGSLRAGRPIPPVPCGSARALSTAKGRLLVEGDDGRVVVSASA